MWKSPSFFSPPSHLMFVVYPWRDDLYYIEMKEDSIFFPPLASWRPGENNSLIAQVWPRCTQRKRNKNMATELKRILLMRILISLCKLSFYGEFSQKLDALSSSISVPNSKNTDSASQFLQALFRTKKIMILLLWFLSTISSPQHTSLRWIDF